MVEDWKKDGVSPMIYINPYFANLTDPIMGKNDQFEYGDKNG